MCGIGGRVGKRVVSGPVAGEVDGEELAKGVLVRRLQNVFHESESVDDELCKGGNATVGEVLRACAEGFPHLTIERSERELVGKEGVFGA